MSNFNYHDSPNGTVTDQPHEKLVLGYKKSMYGDSQVFTFMNFFFWSCVNWHGWSTKGVDSLVGRDNRVERWFDQNKGQYSPKPFFNTH